MKTVERTALLPWSAATMFDLVNDVARYQEFLPGCERSQVLSESDREVVACLTLAKAGIRQQFTTRNLLTPPRRILISLVEGPFSTLEGEWQFTPLSQSGRDNEGCRIDMSLKFDFENRLLNLGASGVFEAVAGKLVDAFCERADALYG